MLLMVVIGDILNKNQNKLIYMEHLLIIGESNKDKSVHNENKSKLKPISI